MGEEVGGSSKDSLAHQKHIDPVRGRAHPTRALALRWTPTQVFVGFARHPLAA